MIKLSFWARNNRRLARLLLIISFVVLYFIGIGWGVLLRNTGSSLSSAFLYATLLVFGIFYLMYPDKKQKQQLGSIPFLKATYKARFGLTICLLALLVFAGNRPDQVKPYMISEARAIVPAKDSPSVKYWSISEFRAMMKDANGKKLKLKERKKLLKQQISMIKRSSTGDGEKALLIALSILAALGAMYLVLILSCSIACNDMGGLAIFVLLAGTTLVAFGLIKIIRRIVKGRPEVK